MNSCMVYIKPLNCGAAAHTVLTELDDQKLLSCGTASVKVIHFSTLNKQFQLILRNDLLNKTGHNSKIN